jgi:hypothetical protein
MSSNPDKGQIYQLKKMMKHIQTKLKGNENTTNTNATTNASIEKKMKAGASKSIFSYIKYYLDSVFDKENFVKKQKEEQLNGIKEPYDTTVEKLAEINPVDNISPAVAFETFQKSVEQNQKIEEMEKEYRERPEIIAETKQLLDEGNAVKSAAVENIGQIKQGILDDLKEATDRLNELNAQVNTTLATVQIPTNTTDAMQPLTQPQSQSPSPINSSLSSSTTSQQEDDVLLENNTNTSKLLKKCDLLK